MLMDAFFLNCGLLVEDDFDLAIWYHDNVTGSTLSLSKHTSTLKER